MVEITPYGAHDYFARIDPHADLDRRPTLLLDLVGEEVDPPLHPQRRVARANRVVLVGHRRPEEGHDPIAHHLVDSALVVMNGFHHAFEHRVENLAGLLGVPVGQELHRTLEVGEEHGDLLALAFEGGLRGQDAFGEMLGRVGLGRSEAGGRLGRLRRSGRERSPATVAELAAGLHLGATGSADSGKRCAALSAESCAVAVGGLAPGTRHGRGSSPPP
jgi:hypothetical protein